MKKCFKCGDEKPVGEFYRHPYMSDGRLGKCKECTKSDVRSNRRAKQDYYAEYDRRRGNRWKAGYYERWRASNGEKYRAHIIVNNAVRDKRLSKEPCFMCGTDKVFAHHPDYSKPLSVVWLCQRCHKRIHAYEELSEKIKCA